MLHSRIFLLKFHCLLVMYLATWAISRPLQGVLNILSWPLRQLAIIIRFCQRESSSIFIKRVVQASR